MSIPPSKPGNPNRARLAARLMQLRASAGLSGNALAKRMGVVQSRVWKIENVRLLPTEDDIRAWARVTGNEQETDDLMQALAEARGEQAFNAVIRQRGAAAYQDQVRALEEQSTRVGEFSVAYIPGFLQTAEYAQALYGLPGGLSAWEDDDLEGAVNARLRRQEMLYDQSKRIQVVLGEGALRTLVVSPKILAGQLGKLLSVMRLPTLELGVISFAQRMPVYPFGFRVYEDELVITESIAAERYHAVDTDPAEVAVFLKAFEELRRAAVHGDEAEAIIRRALEDLRDA